MALDITPFKQLRRGQQLTLNGEVFSVDGPLAGDLFSAARYLLVGGWGGQFVLDVPKVGAVTYKPGFGAVRTVQTALVDGERVAALAPKKVEAAPRQAPLEEAKRTTKTEKVKTAKKAKATTTKKAKAPNKEEDAADEIWVPSAWFVVKEKAARAAADEAKARHTAKAMRLFRIVANQIERDITRLRETGEGELTKLIGALGRLDRRANKPDISAQETALEEAYQRAQELRSALHEADAAGRQVKIANNDAEIRRLKAEMRGTRPLSALERGYHQEVKEMLATASEREAQRVEWSERQAKIAKKQQALRRKNLREFNAKADSLEDQVRRLQQGGEGDPGQLQHEIGELVQVLVKPGIWGDESATQHIHERRRALSEAVMRKVIRRERHEPLDARGMTLSNVLLALGYTLDGPIKGQHKRRIRRNGEEVAKGSPAEIWIWLRDNGEITGSIDEHLAPAQPRDTPPRTAETARKRAAKSIEQPPQQAASSRSSGLGILERIERDEWPTERPAWGQLPTGVTSYGTSSSGQRFCDEAGQYWTVLPGPPDGLVRDDGRVVILPYGKARYLLVTLARRDTPAPDISERWMVKGDHSIDDVIRALGYHREKMALGKVRVFHYVGRHREKEVLCKGDLIDVWNCLIDKGLLRDTPRPTDAETARSRDTLRHRQVREEVNLFNVAATKLRGEIQQFERQTWNALAEHDAAKLRERIEKLDDRTRKSPLNRSPDDAAQAQQKVTDLRVLLDRAIGALDASRNAVQEQDRVDADDKLDALAAFEARQDARVERLEERAAKKRAASAAQYQASKSILDFIPMGQPVLVGHHSERRHRRDLANANRAMHQSVALEREADALTRRARAAASNTTISSDDPTAIDQLVEKIRASEAELERFKAINKAIGKPLRASERTAEHNERARKRLGELGLNTKQIETYLKPDFVGRVGIADYTLTNGRANVGRMRKRMDQLRAVSSREGRETRYATDVGEVRVVQEDNRVRVFFPEKPNYPFRHAMRHERGFIYAGSLRAWQRKANSHAWELANEAAREYAADPPGFRETKEMERLYKQITEAEQKSPTLARDPDSYVGRMRRDLQALLDKATGATSFSARPASAPAPTPSPAPAAPASVVDIEIDPIAQTPSVTTRAGITYYRNLKDADSTRSGHTYPGRVLVGQHADVTPGKSIRIHGTSGTKYGHPAFDLTFNLGDEAVYGSYNLVYTGRIVSIGKSTVAIRDDGASKAKRLTIYQFVHHNNNYDAEQIAAHNTDTMMTI